MNRQPAALCASCLFYPLDPSGSALCSLKGRVFRFDSPACVVYGVAADREARKAVVVQLLKCLPPFAEPAG